MGDTPLPADFSTPREVIEISDDEEDQVSETDEDRVYTRGNGPSAQHFTAMNANYTPASPWAPPSPPFSRPPSSSTGVNHGASWIPQDHFPHAMGFQSHQSPFPAWNNGGAYTNNSHNATTTDMRDSYNNSSINVGDSE